MPLSFSSLSTALNEKYAKEHKVGHDDLVDETKDEESSNSQYIIVASLSLESGGDVLTKKKLEKDTQLSRPPVSHTSSGSDIQQSR